MLFTIYISVANTGVPVCIKAVEIHPPLHAIIEVKPWKGNFGALLIFV